MRYACSFCGLEDCRLWRTVECLNADILSCVTCIIKNTHSWLTLDVIDIAMKNVELMDWHKNCKTTQIITGRVPAIFANQEKCPDRWVAVGLMSQKNWDDWLSLPLQPIILFPRILELT